MRETILDRIYTALGAGQTDVVIPPRGQLAETAWRATGLDSLGVIELALQLEEALQCEITNEMLQHVETFGDLAGVVAAQVMRGA